MPKKPLEELDNVFYVVYTMIEICGQPYVNKTVCRNSVLKFQNISTVYTIFIIIEE
jgi:hypothetical protein